MSEMWIGCPGCGLKHRLRAEGTCPRCRAAVVRSATSAAASEALAPPALPATPEGMPAVEGFSREEGPEGIPPLRWAGALMLANVAMMLVEMGLLRYYYLFDPRQTAGRFVSILIDAVLGTLLVLGQERPRSLASFRALVGGVIFTLILLSRGEILFALIQAIFSATLLTLLSESPPRSRVRLALGAALGLLVLQGFGIHQVIDGKQRAVWSEMRQRELEYIKRIAR